MLQERARLFVHLSIVSVFVGCSDPRTPAVVVADSAGVRVTLSGANSAVFAELDSIPEVSIGGPDATGPGAFFRIQGVHVDPRGRFWVADGQSGELRIFERDGSHWKTRGGQGEGPGEFAQVRLLGSGGGDTVLVGDRRIDRLSIFDPEGEFVRTERVLGSDGPAPRLVASFRDGSILGQEQRIVSASSVEPGQILRDSAELVRVNLPSSAIEDYGTAAGPLWLWTGRNQVPVPFTVEESFAVVGDAVHLVSGPEFRVEVLEAGELLETYGVDRPARPVGESDLEAYRSLVEEYVDESVRADYLSALEHPLRPALLPGYDRILAARDGYLWAQVYETDPMARHRWDVYDSERHFVGQVSVDGGFFPMVITATHAVGVWRGPLGVEYVRSYRLNRP